MNDTAARFIWAAAGAASGAAAAIFAAGVKYANLRHDLEKARGDLNGLGKKYYRITALLIRWADTDTKRAQLADMMEPPK